MNIVKEFKFNQDKPAIMSIKKNERMNYFAVGLMKNQLLSKHKTPIPTFLTVLKGTIEFKIDGEIIELNEYDTFEIPIGIEHEVKGTGIENIFTLIQER